MGVLFAGFGSPSPSEGSIRDFLKNLYGREPSKEEVNKILKRYEKIGTSPFMDKIKSICDEISKRKGFVCAPVMKYTPPFFEDVIKKIRAENFVIFPLSPFSTGRDFSEELKSILLKDGHKVKVIEDWGLSDLFVRVTSNFIKKQKISNEIIFTAHSLPRAFQNYKEKVYKSAKMIAVASEIEKFFIAFQSGRGGWLSPSLDDILKEIKSDEFFLLPFGFFAECLETLYDLDVLFKSKADSFGLKLKRLPALSEIEGFVDFLISMIREVM